MSARILVVDDIEANVRLLQAKLEAEYYEVLSAPDGPTALTLAVTEKPDIVVLDVMMPLMDGFTVCRRLKENPETRHIPVVLRSEERRVGKECAMECRSRWSPYH